MTPELPCLLPCTTCRFAFTGGDLNGEVECRRYAPRALHGSGTGYSDTKFPIVDGHGCGEWMPHQECDDDPLPPDYPLDPDVD